MVQLHTTLEIHTLKRTTPGITQEAITLEVAQIVDTLRTATLEVDQETATQQITTLETV